MNNSILNEGYNSKGPKFIKAKGSYIFDGKKLIDLSFCAGSIILGHNHYVFKNAIKHYLKKDISNFAAPNIYAENYAKKLTKKFKNCSKIIFCNSGTEAIIKSLRIVILFFVFPTKVKNIEIKIKKLKITLEKK